MLTFEYLRPHDERRPSHRGYVIPKNPNQLAGHRFEELELSGTMNIKEPIDIRNIRDWLHRIQGCIQMGNLRKSEPVGEVSVKCTLGMDCTKVTVQATLKCGNDCLRLAQAIEMELTESDMLPPGAMSRPMPAAVMDAAQIGQSYRGLGQALQQAVQVPAGKGIRSLLEGMGISDDVEGSAARANKVLNDARQRFDTQYVGLRAAMQKLTELAQTHNVSEPVQQENGDWVFTCTPRK